MKKLTGKLVAIVLTLLIGTGLFVACAKKNDSPLVVGYLNFSGKFSPFLAESSYDRDVGEGMTGAPLSQLDREGVLIQTGINGEKRTYNGKEYTYSGISDHTVEIEKDGGGNPVSTTYTIKLSDKVKFSDGQTMDADDLIFTYYALLDKSYVGAVTLNSVGIKGYEEYKFNNANVSAVTDEAVAQLLANISSNSDLQQAIASGIVAPLLKSEMEWVKSLSAEDPNFGNLVTQFKDSKALFNYFYGIDEGYSTDGKTEEQVVSDIAAQYGYDYKALGKAYAADEAYFATDAEEIAKELAVKELAPAPVANISGIKKLDQYTVEVTTDGYSAPAVNQIAGVSVSPMHYYGDAALYDYVQNRFGFVRDKALDQIDKVTAKPMGAGPYIFEKYENRIVYFKSNPHYYKGEPKIKNVQFKETSEKDKVTGVQTGTLDITDPTASKTAVAAIKSVNSNGQLSGNKIHSVSTDFLGYGYIGINANTVNVGGKPDSEQSKALRKGLATVIASYRDTAIDSYYGENASVIEYPISNTLWAAPRPTDAGYRAAYSQDKDGNAIYTSGMTQTQKSSAALTAAKGYFEQAGFSFTEKGDGSYTVSAYPSGYSPDKGYEIVIPADGKSDHPSYSVIFNAQTELKKLGIKFVINDPADSNVLWDKINGGTQQLWCAAWSATNDPDMYQIYHSSNILGRKGTDSNHYAIADADLDAKIMQARLIEDRAARKATYFEALGIILDWAVEIPVYQRKELFIFSEQRIDTATVTPDMTAYWPWMSEIHLLQMK